MKGIEILQMASARARPYRDVPTGGRGGVFCNLQESRSKGSHAGKEFATTFSVTFFLRE